MKCKHKFLSDDCFNTNCEGIYCGQSQLQGIVNPGSNKETNIFKYYKEIDACPKCNCIPNEIDDCEYSKPGGCGNQTIKGDQTIKGYQIVENSNY